MKKVMSLAIALMFSGMLFAQRGDHRQKDPKEMATMQSEHMKKSLDLSEQQFASVQSINLKFAERMSVLRNDTTLERETRHQRMAELRDQKQAEIGAVLSADQKSKWETERKNFARNHRGERGHRGDGNRNDDLKTLGLSDEQNKKLEAADATFRSKLQNLRNEQLTVDQRKEKVKSARDEHETNVKSILTAEQFAKWKEMKKDRSHKKLKQERYYRK